MRTLVDASVKRFYSVHIKKYETHSHVIKAPQLNMKLVAIYILHIPVVMAKFVSDQFCLARSCFSL